MLERFLAEVPSEITDPAARAAAAESLRKAFYIRLAHASAKARRAKAMGPKARGAGGGDRAA